MGEHATKHAASDVTFCRSSALMLVGSGTLMPPAFPKARSASCQWVRPMPQILEFTFCQMHTAKTHEQCSTIEAAQGHQHKRSAATTDLCIGRPARTTTNRC